jgi:hypothetical protein
MKILTLLLFLIGPPQESLISPFLKWNERKLDWTDFQGDVPEKSPFLATTTAKVELIWNGSGSLIQIEVLTKFNKKKSWVQKGGASLYLLGHEQRHFDLKEYEARCLRQALVNHKFQSAKSVAHELDSLVNYYNEIGDEYQVQYDEETELSKNKTNQTIWNKRIDSLLSSKEKFSNTELEIDVSYLFKK